MKKTIVSILILALLLTPAIVLADKQPPKNPGVTALVTEPPSWFGTYGMKGYAGLAEGYVYAAELNYPLQSPGFYAVQGQAFIGQSLALTQISGSCFVSEPVNMRFTAYLSIDGQYTVPLFDTYQSVGTFNVTHYGQSFVIVIHTDTPLGCNILFEKVK